MEWQNPFQCFIHFFSSTLPFLKKNVKKRTSEPEKCYSNYFVIISPDPQRQEQMLSHQNLSLSIALTVGQGLSQKRSK